MSVLLVGCTGFLGQALLYQLLTRTTYKLLVVCRRKYGLSAKRRVAQIMKELGLANLTRRVRTIPIKYDTERFDLAMNAHHQHMIRNEASILINALADTRVSTGIKAAIETNTSIALQWLLFFKSCINAKKYIYISDAFVNFHRGGRIEEIIYQTQLDRDVLRAAKANEPIDIAPYSSPYLLSKQLSEILLTQHRGDLDLAILRPSLLAPAVQRPYCGWSEPNKLSALFSGISVGLISAWGLDKESILEKHLNQVPVDIAARDILSLIKSKKSYTIRHCCLTGNNIYCITFFSFYSYLLEAIRYFTATPLKIYGRTLHSYFPLQQKILHNRYLLICPFLKNLYQNKKSFIHFFRLLRDSIKYSHTINQYLPYFISKNVVFNRKNKSKWFYKHLSQDIAYKNFIQNIQKTIHKNKIIMNVLR